MNNYKFNDKNLESQNTNRTIRNLFVIITIGILLLFTYYYFAVTQINNTYHKLYNSNEQICLRKFPYPYKAAIAICSDVDSTSTFEEFLEIQKFMNSKDSTNMGFGVGLEIGNSFFMFDSTNIDNFSYFSIDPSDQEKIRKLIKSGYIDCLHSWGEGCCNRYDAIQALSELEKYNLKMDVWVNHSNTRTNLGHWMRTNFGDNADSKYYHADLTIPYGIKYVWLGESTHTIGQSTPISFSNFIGSCDSQYRLKSIVNVGKSIVKHFLAIFGLNETNYSLHKNNELAQITSLDDGQKVYEFIRYDNHPNGIGKGATSKGLAYNISQRVLDQLKKVHGYAIVYSHLGKNGDGRDVIHPETQKALRNLEQQYRNGEVFVVTTSRLLNYYTNFRNLKWTYEEKANEIFIQIQKIEDPVFGDIQPTLENLQGFTFYVPNGVETHIFINTHKIEKLQINPPDENSRISVSIPLQKLHYPSL